MTTSTLIHEWSLDKIAPPASTSSTCARPDAKTIVLNTLLLNRWGIHSLSTVIDAVPLSQDRLRNEGLIPFYTYLVTANRKIKEIALTQGVAVPSYPDVCDDHAKECALDDEALLAKLAPHVTGPPAHLLEGGAKVVRARQKYHWGTLVAHLAVAAEIMSTQMQCGKNTVTAIACEELAPLKEFVVDKVMAETMGVIGEEMMKCRSGAATTGWREEEAKELVTEHAKLMKTYLSPPQQ